MSLDIIKYNTHYISKNIHQFLACNPNSIYSEAIIDFHVYYYNHLLKYFYELLPISNKLIKLNIYIHNYKFYLINSCITIQLNSCELNNYKMLMRFKIIFLYKLLKNFYNKNTKKNMRKWLFYKNSINYIYNL